MGVFPHIDQLPHFRRPVVTIGTFDGVHLGHRAILSEVVDKARQFGGESVLVTFDPHPRKLLFPQQDLRLLTPLEDKLRLIAGAGIDHTVVAPFTPDFAALSASEYIREFLVKRIAPSLVIIGYDHHFGSDRKGNIDLLKAFAGEGNYEVQEIPVRMIEAAAVSSTQIRRLLGSGQVEEANRMLGRRYSVSGTVVHGDKRGRLLGYPTANLRMAHPDQLLPASGVYAVEAQLGTRTVGGMLNIGTNPTFTDDRSVKIETHLFDFDEDLYGRALTLRFAARLRDELRFDGIDALREALAEDERQARALLG